jgi:predicted enzyme related to lactoylglutathione lyase
MTEECGPLPLRRVAEVVLFVPDLEAARAWYRDLLGSDVAAWWQDGYGWFEAAGVRLGLHLADAKTPAGVGGVVPYWEVDALEAALRTFITHGGRLYRGPVTGVDGARVAQVQDPFGNFVGLVEASV